jgi:hypothetical protein
LGDFWTRLGDFSHKSPVTRSEAQTNLVLHVMAGKKHPSPLEHRYHNSKLCCFTLLDYNIQSYDFRIYNYNASVVVG